MDSKRKIVKIDEEKCDGCGLCVPNCAEGALQIIDGKARLVKDIYCDGLGACLGHCPQGAITIEEREADAFDGEASKRYIEGTKTAGAKKPAPAHAHACPSMMFKNVNRRKMSDTAGEDKDGTQSELTQWPVQLALVPPQAPYLKGADILIAADCVAFAYADFHRRFLKGKALVIGCPKLDDIQSHIEKLEQIFRHAGIRSITVAYMEVPCCFGLAGAVNEAMKRAGADIPVREVIISVNGEILKDETGRKTTVAAHQ